MSLAGRTALTLHAADGVRLAAAHLPPAARQSAEHGTAVVLAPGFSGWSGRPAVRQLVSELHRSAPSLGIVLVDLRGHGASDGQTTLGDREVFDVDAAVRAARDLGYRRVITMGWSMGATCVLRHAALVGTEVHCHPLRCPVDAVVTVSAISRWDVRDTAAMRRLHRIIETRIGRALARRFFHVRIAPDAWIPPEATPADAIAEVSVPLLVVHGENDHYYGGDHARALVRSAPTGATLWLVPGLGHAEDAAVRPDVPGFVDRLGTALEALAAGLPVPAWDDEASGVRTQQ
jgi:pimeloyl-ACP methyl ester carboxylesterase